MPLIHWMNRHGWIFSLTGLLCTAGALYLAVPPLLRWGNSGSFFLWLLEAFFVTVIILALCYVPLRGFRILRLSAQLWRSMFPVKRVCRPWTRSP